VSDVGVAVEGERVKEFLFACPDVGVEGLECGRRTSELKAADIGRSVKEGEDGDGWEVFGI
jgi:hypothetical protein